jgi:hypothetical protein
MKVQKTLKCWMTDGRYDEKDIEALLQEAFGNTRTMFDVNNKFSGTKVAVTAASISDASCFLFTNYNSAVPRNRSCGNHYHEIIVKLILMVL